MTPQPLAGGPVLDYGSSRRYLPRRVLLTVGVGGLAVLIGALLGGLTATILAPRPDFESQGMIFMGVGSAASFPDAAKRYDALLNSDTFRNKVIAAVAGLP